ncbi:type II secretion system protein GspM [Profundibacter sp.]
MKTRVGIMPYITVLSGFIILGGLIWFAILLPASEWKAKAFSELAQSRAEQSKLSESLARLKVERAQLSGDTALDIIWKAKRMGEATALVQSEISNIAAKHGVSIRSITPVPAKEIPFANSIGFRIEGETTLDKLTTFLVDLEANSPALAIERAVLRRLTRPGRTAPQPDVFLQLNLIAPVELDEEEKT